MTLGEYADLYGENFITADAVGEDFKYAEHILVFLPTEAGVGRGPSRVGKRDVRHLGKFESPCSQNGGCPNRGVCSGYALACQSFYQWVNGPLMRPKFKATHPLTTPCRDMYLKVFTSDNPDHLPVPPIDYIVRENQTIQEMHDARISSSS